MAERAPPRPETDAIVEERVEEMAEQFEGGYRSRPYQDAGGTWTIGYGSTHTMNGHKVCRATKPISQAMAKAIMVRDLCHALQIVLHSVTVPLSENEAAALTDFVYNEGEGAYLRSDVLRYLNAGEYQKAADAFLRWDRVKGHHLAQLARRRHQERQMFLTPDEGAPKW